MRTALTVVCLVVLAAAGCVERRMTILSEPSGATVYLDGDEIGRTPVTTSFTFYGGREIRLEREGCQPLVVVERFEPPVYERFPIDLVTELLVPWTITDWRYLPYKLSAEQPADRAALIERAQQYRSDCKALIASERAERRAEEREKRRAERRELDKQRRPKKKWYRLFF